MDIIFLEEALEDLLPAGFQITTDPKSGQIVIMTHLVEDPDDGELVEMDSDDEDLDLDPDFEPLEDDMDDDD